MKLAVPTLNRYDLLQKLLDSAERGSVKPDGYLIVDNGGEARARLRLPPNVQVIEPGRNIGVAASWNLILDAAGDEPIAISNDDITLGHGAFAMLTAAAARHPLVTAGSWALFAQAPECTRVVGPYDEGFYPAYYEDTDFAYRMTICNVPRHDVQVEATHVGSATIKAAPSLNVGRSGSYYHAKWGGPPDRERWREPFGGKIPEGWALRASKWRMRRKTIIDYIYHR